MRFAPEKILDRKLLKRSLLKWKTFSILLFFIFITFAFGNLHLIDSSLLSKLGLKPRQNVIAKIKIEGVILRDFDRESAISSISENPNIKAVILHINSPGGSLVGGETLYNALMKLSSKKPLVVVMGDIATSGAYMAALASERIFSNIGTITGSIGVILQNPNLTSFLETLGINMDVIKSSELKALPSLYEKLTPAARNVLQESIEVAANYFVSLVSARRKITIEEAKKLSDGRIYLGTQALNVSLIDAIGTEDDAKLWLQKEKNITGELVNYSLKQNHKKKFGIFSAIKQNISILNNLYKIFSTNLLAI